jgi:hypothetical protein
MKRLLLSVVALLAGCARSEDPSAAAPDSNQIERLASPKEEEPDFEASARLEPLRIDDVANLLVVPRCTFNRNEELLISGSRAEVVARIGGQVRHLPAAGPVGPTGGFFEDRELSISVGRTADGEGAEREVGDAPARAATTNRTTNVQSEAGGVWSCQ